MNDAELARQLTAGNAWWRDPDRWESDDRDLKALRESPLRYAPDPLDDIADPGLYVLRGPRRVGKSVELKRAVGRLLHIGAKPRQIIHCACDGLTGKDLRRLQSVGRDQLTGSVDGPRYWLLDEITAVPGWPDAIKWLRDNTAMAGDCVVLTGSSGRDLEGARKALAGRRGKAARSDRLLMPMSFRSFCAAAGGALPEMPVIRSRDFLSREAEDAVGELLPWLDRIVSLWETYLRVGGFPRAVGDYLESGAVSPSFVDDLWDVIHGDALRRENFSAAQSMRLLRRLTRSIASPINMTALAEDIGVGSHSTAGRRVKDLIDAYCAWPCHQRGDGQLPNLAAQGKVYFADPLLARLAQLRADQPEPDASQVSEQQIGLALTLSFAAEDPGRYADFSAVMYAKSATGREVDFCGRPFGPLAFEAKYTDRGLRREAQTLRAMFDSGVLATRASLDRIDGVRALPAGIVALLLNPAG
ncbi:MAG: AAA family ATPase [Thermoleophilaceae bacterium]